MMNFVVMIGVGIGAYVLGVFGFAQIIGSLQNASRRGTAFTLFTIVLWTVILIGGWFLMHTFAPSHKIVYYIPSSDTRRWEDRITL